MDTADVDGSTTKVVDNTASAPLMDEDDLKKDNQPFGGYTIEKKNVVYRTSEIIGQAITTMEHDIKLSEFECKENMEIINGHFEKLFASLTTKKEELLSSLNTYYETHKNETEERIKELKAKQIEEEEKEKDPNYNPIMATMQAQDLQPTSSSKQIFKKMKKMASKKNATEKEEIKEEPLTTSRNKLRIFFPAKTLNQVIDEEIRIGTDYWNALKLDHNKWTVHDSKIWRVESGGHWCNAFGSTPIGYTQKKRWDVRILPFENCDLSKPADVVIGIVDADKVGAIYEKNKGKRGSKNVVGFWKKDFDGFGFWGWNGKILHGSDTPAVYTENKGWNVNSVVSVELDMRLDIGANMSEDKKKKKKAKFVKNKEKKGMIATGATISFYVDDKCLGYAFYDIDVSKKYVLAVAMNQNHYVLQLLN